MKLTTFFALSCLPSALLLAGCGSGGGSSDTPMASAPAPAPAGSVYTDAGHIEGFAYTLSNHPSVGMTKALEADILSNGAFNFDRIPFLYPTEDRVVVNYTNDNGFVGLYSYKGETGHIVNSDVAIEVTYRPGWLGTPSIRGWIGRRKPIVLGGDYFGRIELDYSVDVTGGGKFIDNDVELSGDENYYNSIGTIKGSFSNDGTSSNYPDYVAGEVELVGFSKEWDDDNAHQNSIVGVFVAEEER